MSYNRKFKTPLLQAMRTNCGTMYTFSSALEDIGLNINERNNIVKLSNYAILNLPSVKSSKEIIMDGVSDENYKDNNFNFHNILGNYAYIHGLNGDTTFKDKTEWQASELIPLSLQSYAMNLETALLANEEYDATLPLTVSERVFWKWLKESGAIRWHKNGDIIQEEESSNYNKVVQCIGNITSGAFKSNSFSNFNEALIQLPTSFGHTPSHFKQISDDNYYFGKHISINEGETNLVIGQTEGSKEGLPNVAFYDYINSSEYAYSLVNNTNNTHTLMYSLDESNIDYNLGWWYTPQNNVPSKKYTYVIDEDFSNDDTLKGYENTYLKIGNNKLVRSNYDCMCLDFNISSYKNEYKVNSFDELATLLSARGYEFNATLVYYSVYNSSNTAILATNLLGILFFDGGLGSFSSVNSDVNGEMYIPTFEKFKSNSINNNGTYVSEFGNSFNFRINLQSNNLKDDTAAYIEDTTSLNYLDDFTKVYANLNQAINILGGHTKTINGIYCKYTNMESMFSQQNSKIANLDKKINIIVDKLHIDLLGFNTPTIRIGKNIASSAVVSINSTVIGYNSCFYSKNLQNTVALGNYTGYNCEENTNNIFIGNMAGYNEINSFKLHIESNENFIDTPLIEGDFSDNNREIKLNSNTIKMPSLNSVGSGIALVWDNGELKLAASSMRYKSNIKHLENSNVLDLIPREFTYTSDLYNNICYGLLAEEVERIDKNLVIYDEDGNPNGVKYEMISVLLIKEIQKLKNKIDDIVGLN